MGEIVNRRRRLILVAVFSCLAFHFIDLPFILSHMVLDKDYATADPTLEPASQQTRKGSQFHIMHCVPHYSLLASSKSSQVGRGNRSVTALLLLSAYNYDAYIVVTTQADGWFGRRVYCRYLSDNFEEIYPSIESFVYPEFAVHCCANSKAKYMSITTDANDSLTTHVAIQDRRLDEPKYFLSLCLAPMYGNETKWLLLVELIEHYKLQGVEHFYLYLKHLDAYTLRLVKSYESTGEVESVFFREYEDRIGKYWQWPGIEDCLQRSRHQSRYVLFHDLDERIIPMANFPLKNFIKMIMENGEELAAMEFTPQRIYRIHPPPLKYQGKATLNQHLPTLVYHQADPFFRPELTKYLADPRYVLTLHVHFVEVYLNKTKCYSVPTDVAVIGHYRDVTRREIFVNTSLTDRQLVHWEYPRMLMPILYENVERRLNEVYGVSTAALNYTKASDF